MVGNIRHTVVAVEGAEERHLRPSADEEVVDLLALGFAKGIVGGGVVAGVGNVAGGNEFGSGQGEEDAVLQSGVHVAPKDDAAGVGVAQRAELEDGVAAGCGTYVVEVGVEICEIAVGHEVVEQTHGDGTAAGGIPSEADAVGGLAQPVGVLVEELEAVGAVEDAHDFAVAGGIGGGQPVVAAHADALIHSRQSAVEVNELVGQNLLHPDGVGSLFQNHGHHSLLALRPGVGTVLVLGPLAAEADVKRHEFQIGIGFWRVGATHDQSRKKCDNTESLHLCKN